MQKKVQDLATNLDITGAKIQGETFGNMTAAYINISQGVDFTPLLEGLPHNHCQCPHWGYVIKGKIRVKYQDGQEEIVEGGQAYYWPSGHTVIFEEDTEYVEFSPKKEMDEVFEHVGKKLASAS